MKKLERIHEKVKLVMKQVPGHIYAQFKTQVSLGAAAEGEMRTKDIHGAPLLSASQVLPFVALVTLVSRHQQKAPLLLLTGGLVVPFTAHLACPLTVPDGALVTVTVHVASAPVPDDVEVPLNASVFFHADGTHPSSFLHNFTACKSNTQNTAITIKIKTFFITSPCAN
ncbi:MAG: hypothetical protein LBQ49_02915 [Rickettsiales bacterium]|nr:hypothetical protein [Rickettsiales bacterium]